jgi:nitronate monooxygenase
VNQIVHRTNNRLDEDMALCEKWQVPMLITSLGAREDVYQAAHRWGGIVLHDVINDMFARKAIEKGADGLIPVAAGAGGHAGAQSPCAGARNPQLVRWPDRAVGRHRPRQFGAGSAGAGRRLRLYRLAWIATHEARAIDAYKQAIVDSSASDIVYSTCSPAFTATICAARSRTPASIPTTCLSAIRRR